MGIVKKFLNFIDLSYGIIYRNPLDRTAVSGMAGYNFYDALQNGVDSNDITIFAISSIVFLASGIETFMDIRNVHSYRLPNYFLRH